jgi:hypothetical protein
VTVKERISRISEGNLLKRRKADEVVNRQEEEMPRMIQRM